METFVAVARKWGNSKGVVLPPKLHVEAGDELILSVQSTKRLAKVKDLFGKCPLGGNTARILKQVDKELDIRW